METTINLRIQFDLKLELEELASENNLSLSQCIRKILAEHIENSINPENYQNETDEQITVVDWNKNEYEKSFDFTYLLTWLFYKQMNPIYTSNNETIKSIKNKIELTVNLSSFSNELKLEFVKILNDVNRVIVEPDYDNKQFYFSIPNNHSSFDYFKLMNEIWSLKH